MENGSWMGQRDRRGYMRGGLLQAEGLKALCPYHRVYF